MTELDLFSYPPADVAQGKRATSREAALALQPKVRTIRQRVADMLKEHPHGFTSEEIAGHLRLSYATVQPRTSELAKAGLIEDSGRRRANGTGKRAIVWTWAGSAK